MFGFVSPKILTAKLFVLASSTNVVLAPGINNVLYSKYTSFATVILQLIVLTAVRFVVAAVAVSNVLLSAITVGVPDIFEPVNDNPVGNALAVYVIPEPTALVALSVTLDIALFAKLVYVVPFAGLAHVTTSGVIVKLKLRLVSCNCASVALTINVYVVGLADN